MLVIALLSCLGVIVASVLKTEPSRPQPRSPRRARVRFDAALIAALTDLEVARLQHDTAIEVARIQATAAIEAARLAYGGHLPPSTT